MTDGARFLERYLRTLDGETPEDVLPMLAAGFRFSVLWTVDGEAHEFAGGLDELHAYMAQREPDGHVHHVIHASGDATGEVVFGRTTRHGEPLAVFTMAVNLDADGRATHLYAARTTSLQFGDLRHAAPPLDRP